MLLKLLNILKNNPLFIAFLLAIIALGLLIPFPNPVDSLVMNPFANLLHLPIGLLAVILINLFLHANNRRLPSSFAGAFTFALACLFEIIQDKMGRNGSFIDIFITFWGILAGIAFLEIYIEKSSDILKFKILFFVSLFIGLLVSIPPVFIGYKLWEEREMHYPVLIKPDTYLTRLVKPIENSQLIIDSDPTCAIYTETINNQWSGFELPVGEKDWSIFSYLEIVVKNKSDKPIEILVRVDDDENVLELDQRYNSKHLIDKLTEKSLKIPMSKIKNSVKGKKFNLNKINSLVIGSKSEIDNQGFCISSIELISRS